MLRKQSTVKLNGTDSAQDNAGGSSKLSKRKSTSVYASNPKASRLNSDMETTFPGTSMGKKSSSKSGSLKKKTSSIPLLANLNFRRRRKNIKAPVIFDPSEEPKPKTKKKKQRKDTTPSTPQRELYYRRGEYLAVKTEDDDFYLCQTTQHVYADLDEFTISWLENSARKPLEYTRGQNDRTELDCVITHVRLRRVEGKKDTYYLPEDQKLKIENSMTGDDSEEEEEEEEEDESEEEEEPPPKRRKKPAKKVVSKKTAKKPGKKAKSKGKPAKPKAAKKGKKKADKPEKATKRKLTEAERRNPNLLLVTNPKVKVIDKDPALQSNQPIPFVSMATQCKLVHRAVMMNDTRTLKKLIDDRKNIPSVEACYADMYKYDPMELAIKRNNKEAIKLLGKELFLNTKERVQPPESYVTRQDTGRYNPRSLGIPFVRELTISRGGREGNNALLKDLTTLKSNKSQNDYLIYALECGLPLSTIDVLHASMISDWAGQRDYVYDHLVAAVRRGHRELAGKLVEAAMDHCFGNPFNNLHKNVLQFKNEDLGKFRDISCQKKPFTNYGITPIHCAAINPNAKYLTRLLGVLPEYNLPDKQNRRPIHYAAACSGTGPLEYLLKRGVDSDDVDNLGMTPLMVAAMTNREANVDLLLKTAKEKMNNSAANEDDDEGSEDGYPAPRDFGVGGVNRTCARPTSNLCGYAAIHLAIQEGHENVLKVLLRYGSDIHQPLGPRMKKMTPLMLAAAMGRFNMCRMLYGCKARVEEKDRLKRTALIHASMNGHAHVVSYLLNLGADPNATDTSGNTAMHYAAAYGWPFVVKLLVEAGAEPNRLNDWKITPMWMCYLKGYMGMVDQLLKIPQMDINFTDNNGLSLLMIACSSPLVPDLEKQIEDMVLKRGADVTLQDKKGNTCLHQLAANSIMTEENKKSRKKLKKVMDMSVRIAEMLLDAGCDATQANIDGQLPISLAVMESNVSLVKVLSKAGRALPTKADNTGSNLLHHMAKRCLVADQTAILKTLVEGGPQGQQNATRDQLKDMARIVNHTGYTPLLTACQAYANGLKETSVYEDSDDESDYDEDENEDEQEEKDEDEEAEEDAEDEPMEDEDGGDDLDHAEVNGDVETDEGIEEDEQMDDDDEEEEEPEEEEPEEEPEEEEDMEEEDEEEEEEDDDDEGGMKKEQLAFKHGRGFIKTLLELCGADVNAQVQKRKFTDPDFIPREPEEFYHKGKQAEYRAINYMLQVRKEAPVTLSSSKTDRCPGLSLLLQHGATLDHFTLSGNSPLTQVITGRLPQDVKVDAVKKLIDAGANVNLVAEYTNRDNKKKNTAPPVVLAAKVGLAKVIAELLHGRVNLEAQDSLNGNTALHYAVQKQRETALDMVGDLVKAGAKVNARNKKRQTPLHLAANANVGGSDVSSEVETLLLDSGADMKAQDVFGRTPLHYVFVNEGNPFMNNAIDPIELCSTLTSSIGSSEVNIPDKYGCRALHYASLRGAGVCAMNLLQKKANINLKDIYGNTAFGMSALSNHSSCCILLLQQGANFNTDVTLLPGGEKKRITREEQRAGLDPDEEEEEEDWFRPKPLSPDDWNRYPAFQVCVHNQWQGVLYIMLDRLAQVGLLPVATVQAALKTHSYNLALTLIRKIKDTATLVQIDDHGQNLFHTLAAHSKHSENKNLQLRVAQLLHSRGVSLKTRDDYGCQPIHYACLHNNTVLTKFILDKEKIDTNVKSSSGHTAATAACWNLVNSRAEELPNNFKTVCTEQLNRGAKLDILALFPKVPVITAVVSGSTQPADMSAVVKEFQETKDCVLQSPLIFSITMHDFPACKFLLKKGARVNFTDQNQMTPLMRAVQRNDMDLVKLLMDHTFERESSKAGGDTGDMEDDEQPDDGSEDEDDDDDMDAGPSKRRKTNKGRAPRRVFALGEKQSSLTKQDSVKEAVKPFKRKSNVEMNHQDNRGWTVLHHLVSPLEYGTFDNVDILQVLVDNGAKLDVKNNEGLTPLNLALMTGAVQLAQALQKMTKIPASMQREMMLLPVSVDDGIKWDNPPPDFRDDADKMIKSRLGDDAPKDETYKPTADKMLELGDDGEILIDQKLNEPFDVMLIKIDVGRGIGGLYNFYKMQIAHQKSTNIYFLFNCWGRIGDTGQHQKTPFSTEQEAITEFKKIFKSKTANVWDKLDEFENHKGKYSLVRVEEKVVKKKYRPVTLELALNMPSRLSQPVRKLVQEFSNMGGMCSFMEQLELDTKCMPFGRIPKAGLLEAKEILIELAPLIKKLEDLRTKGAADHTDEIHVLSDQIMEMNNAYHSKIPQEGFQYNTLTCISTSHQLQTEFRNLEHLHELELAGRMISGAQYRAKEMNPLDYIYRCLDCQIEPMQFDDVEAQYLRTYIKSSQERNYDTIRLRGIYRLQRQGEEEKLMSRNLENHKILFHGTKTFNMLSILRRGLVVGPKEAPATGSRLGKGIYFTDAFSKSVNYCENMNKEGNDNFMLVCQVALGKVQNVYSTDEPVKRDVQYDAIKAIGEVQPDPKHTVTLPTGAVIPLGSLKQIPPPKEFEGYQEFEENEYVVDQEDQICMRYLVRFSTGDDSESD